MPFLIPLTIAGAVLSMLVPVHPRLLDLLLIVNMIFAGLLLLSSLTVGGSLKLTSLPTMLVLGTLFRLSLNVSSTRLILLGESPGKVIEACGALVVGGELLVGVVIFLVITIVQFLVIAKGAERVAEVSARFTLDALPGKQMSIDADVRAGILDGNVAREKREEIALESRFYAALDGAMKFIKGDAIAAILIVAINLIGGVATGLIRGMPLNEVLRHYSLLSVGDGLVSQIPALMSSLAACIVVTRVSKEGGNDIGSDIIHQLGGSQSRLIIIGGMLIGCAWLPLMPVVPLVAVGGALLGAGCLGLSKKQQSQILKSQKISPHPECLVSPVLEFIPYNSDTFKKYYQSSEIFSRFFQEEAFKKWGIVLHQVSVVVKRDPESKEGVSLLRLRGIPIAQYDLESTTELDINKVVSPLRDFLPELVDEQSIRRTIEYLEPQCSDIVSSFLSSSATYGQAAVVCRELVSHGFTLKALPQILQMLAEPGSDKRPTLELIDLVRLRIKRQLCFECLVEGTGIKAITLSVGYERALIKNISQNLFETGLQLIELAGVVERLVNEQPTISAVVVNHSLRRAIADALGGRNSRIKVLSYDELVTGFDFEELKRISHEDLIKDVSALAA